MLLLGVCVLGVTVCAAILFYLLRILKNQKSVAKSIKYQATFESKEPKGVLLFYGFQFITYLGVLCVIFMIYDFSIQNIIDTIAQSIWQSKIVMIGLFSFLVGSCLWAIFEIAIHFNLYLKVDNDTLIIRNKFRKLYIIDKSHIEFVQVCSPRRRNDQSVCVKFVDESKTRWFSMMMHWEEFLLLREWVKYHKVPAK